ncbi:hypothetical protein HDU96_001775 [Phlyctochytrium bullatum]|nr:hypothetical protein HDU96_001775 [Phlyctochytrium bullatum]
MDGSKHRKRRGAKKHALSDTDKSERLANLRIRAVILNKLHPTLRNPVLGDYLDSQHPRKAIMKVVKSYQVAMLLQQLLPQNPRPLLLPLMEKANVRTLREAAKTVANLKRTMELGRTVFGLFWKDISRIAAGIKTPLFVLPSSKQQFHEPYLNARIAEVAKRCNEAFSFLERRRISWELSPRDLRAEIAFEMEAESGCDQDYFLLLGSSTFGEFWSLQAEYPSHPDHQKDAVKARIAKYLQQKKAGELAEVLKASFKRHGVGMRSDSNFIKEFSAGTVFCHPEQVVATLYLAGKLFDIHYTVWSQLKSTFELELKLLVYKKTLGWMEAAKKLTSAPEFHRKCDSVHLYTQLISQLRHVLYGDDSD